MSFRQFPVFRNAIQLLDPPRNDGGRLYLVDGSRLSSTHILKPDPGRSATPQLAVNEHFCMTLARRMGLPAAEVSLLRTPHPVLVVRRFDREEEGVGEEVRVMRRHIIDACQACDLPVSFKYERNLGIAPEVRNIRDGVSFERLFQCADITGNKAAARLAMLRWALFQFLIGNSDAHGRNFSFFVRPGGLLEPAPWNDLVSVLQYDGFDTELAMAYGDVFEHGQVTAFALAAFATRCGIAHCCVGKASGWPGSPSRRRLARAWQRTTSAKSGHSWSALRRSCRCRRNVWWGWWQRRLPSRDEYL